MVINLLVLIAYSMWYLMVILVVLNDSKFEFYEAINSNNLGTD